MRRNLKFDDFEKRVAAKRQKTDRPEKQHVVPSDIMVQRMSAQPSGRLKKYEPLDTRDFVPFNGFTELSVSNIQLACEQFYNAPAGSCDVLASDRGPSCSKIEQLKGKKVFFIRFIEVNNRKEEHEDTKSHNSVPISPSKSSLGNTSSLVSKFAKSVSVADLLKAGKLIKKTEPVPLKLEEYAIDLQAWRNYGTFSFIIEKEKFAEGAFREAFKATAPKHAIKNWVVKVYKDNSTESFTNTLNMTTEEHTRKQVQMHSVARNITQRFSKTVPREYGTTFSYNKVYFSMYNGLPVTVEEFVDGDFAKYVNNDGKCITPPSLELASFYRKAECLVHYSYIFSGKTFMLLDIQGSAFKLYDPEIATTNLKNDEKENEILFCAGNLTFVAIEEFKKAHKCSSYCRLVELEPFTDSDESEGETEIGKEEENKDDKKETEK